MLLAIAGRETLIAARAKGLSGGKLSADYSGQRTTILIVRRVRRSQRGNLATRGKCLLEARARDLDIHDIAGDE